MSSINSRVPPLRLMAVDTPSDGQLPSYQSSSGKFEWVDDSTGFTSFTVAGDAGPSQTVTDGNTLTLQGSGGITKVTMSATDTATISLENTAVTPGSYTNADITVDAQGRITSASNGSTTSPGGSDGDFQINNSGSFGGSILSTNKTTTITLNSGASGDPQFQMSSSTKAITLTCDSNSKLKVEGALYSWELDASSASGGITFPDGTTQTTAASGGGSKYAANPLIKAPDQATDNAYFPLNLSAYFLQGNTQITSWNTTDTTAIRLIQALAPKAGTLDELAFRTGSTAGDTLYFAIYDSDSDNMPTGDPIFTFNTGTTTANTQYEPTISLSVTEGQPLWIATFGQTNRTSIWTTYTGSTSVRAWPMVPRLTLTSINYSNDQNQLTLSGLTNGVWPTLSSSTEFDSTLVSYHFKAAIHITE